MAIHLRKTRFNMRMFVENIRYMKNDLIFSENT
jgi:hypothetical protein